MALFRRLAFINVVLFYKYFKKNASDMLNSKRKRHEHTCNAMPCNMMRYNLLNTAELTRNNAVTLFRVFYS